MHTTRKTLGVVLGGVLFLSGWLLGQERAATQKTVIHAAAWTALDTMTPQQFDNFRKESAALVGQVRGLRRVWVGKLRAPITADGNQRNYGLIVEFDDVKTKEGYSANHPSPWYENFNKLRKPGSTNFDVVGE